MDFGFDFGGDFDTGFDGFDPGFDAFGDDFGFGDAEGVMDPSQQMTPEDAQQAIADAIAQEQQMSGDTPVTDAVEQMLSDQLGDQTIGQSVAPTDVAPVQGVPSELSPNQRVDDAFFDMGGQPTVDAPDAGGMTQEMIREGFEKAAENQMMMNRFAGQRASQMGPPAPPPPNAPTSPIPTPRPDPRGPVRAGQSGPTAPAIADRFGDQFATRVRNEAPDAILPPDMVPMPYPRPTSADIDPDKLVKLDFRALERDSPARNYPALAVLSGLTPIPPPANLDTTVTSADALTAINEALRGATPGTEMGLRGLRAFGPEDVETVDPSTLPAPDARITVTPQPPEATETTVEAPAPVGPEGPGELLPPQDVYAPRPAPGTFSDGPTSETEQAGTARLGSGTTDTGADPSEAPRPGESPAQTRQRVTRQRQQQQRLPQQQQQPSSRAPQPGEMNYPITSVPTPPQSVLRTDLRPEEQRVREDVQRVLQQAEPTLERGPLILRPNVAESGAVAQGLPGVEAGQLTGQAVFEKGEDVGNIFNPDPGGGRTAEQRLRSALVIPELINAAQGGLIGGLGKTALQRALGIGSLGYEGFTPDATGSTYRATTDALRGLGAASSRVPAISPDELMGAISALGPSAALAGPQQKRKSKAERDAEDRAADQKKQQLEYLRTQGQTLDAAGNIVPMPMVFPPGEIPPYDWPRDASGRMLDRWPGEVAAAFRPSGAQQQSYWATGTLVTTVGGLLAFPRVYRFFNNHRFSPIKQLGQELHAHVGRQVPLAPPGTKDYSLPSDAVRAALDDGNAGAINMLKRMGASPTAITHMRNLGWMQTRAQAESLVESAIRFGTFNTGTHSFNVKVPLERLAIMVRPNAREFNQYMVASDAYEEMRHMSVLGPASQRRAGNVRDTDFAEAHRVMQQMEAMYPKFVDYKNIYRDILKEIRRFQATGEDATMTVTDRAIANRWRKDEVMMSPRDRKGNDFVMNGDVVQSLAEHMRRVLPERMESTFKGEYRRISSRTQSDALTGPYTPQDLTRMRGSHPERFNSLHQPYNGIMIYNRGVPEWWFGGRTLIDTLKFDPMGLNNWGATVANTSKRMFEFGTTRGGAPWFASANFLRTHVQLKYTMPGFGPWSDAPNIGQSMWAVPRSVMARTARGIHEAIENGSNNWFTRNLPPGMSQRLSNTMARAYYNSWQHVLDSRGGVAPPYGMDNYAAIAREGAEEWQRKFTFTGRSQDERPFLTTMRDNIRDLMNQIGDNHATGRLATTGKGTWNAYENIIGAIHNAPTLAAVARGARGSSIPGVNRPGKSLDEAVLNARIGSADTRVTGVRGIGYEDYGALRSLGPELKRFSTGMEWSRNASPWLQSGIQGIKRIADSYLEHPGEFVTKTILYTQTPAVSSYLWNRWLGYDPMGYSYTDHQMNRRSEFSKNMKIYFGIPGRPASEGIDIYWIPHELIPFARLPLEAAHEMLGNNLLAGDTNVANILRSYLSTAFMPAAPPGLNVIRALQGQQSFEGGLFGARVQNVRRDPNDPDGHLAGNLDLLLKAQFGSLGDILAATAVAFTYPGQEGHERFISAGKTFAGRAVEKDTIWSNVLNIKPPMSGSTELSDWMFERRDAIEKLVQHMERSRPDISLQPQSPSGGEQIRHFWPPGHPNRTLAEIADEKQRIPLSGMPPKPSNNPLYQEFISEIDKTLGRRGDDTGYQSLWRQHGDATQQINSLRRVNAANAAAWMDDLHNNPKNAKLLKWLRDYGVDTTDRNMIMDHWTKVRYNTQRQLRAVIEAAENRMTERAKVDPRLNALMRQHGLTRVRLEDLQPYIDESSLQNPPQWPAPPVFPGR